MQKQESLAAPGSPHYLVSIKMQLQVSCCNDITSGLSMEHTAAYYREGCARLARCPQAESVYYKLAFPKAFTLPISNISLALRKFTWRLLLIWLLWTPTVFCLFSLTSASWELMSGKIRFQLTVCFTLLTCMLLNRVNTNTSEGH